jgi:hypothetical protein
MVWSVYTTEVGVVVSQDITVDKALGREAQHISFEDVGG